MERKNMATAGKLLNFINGEWRPSNTEQYLEVLNPANSKTLSLVPLSLREEVDEAVQAAQMAFDRWRRTPATERIQYLFQLKALLEENIVELSRTITLECGKTFEESRAEMRRAIENVEVAIGIPIMMQGYNSEDIASGIDEQMIRQPVGVCAAICPFNFPGMIPFWFMPYALACGNTYIVKPSERVPVTMQKIFRLVEKAGFPKGVLNLVNGAKECVDALLDHPMVRALSFVGSTPVAKYLYSRAAAEGKRAQCQGGAKNPVIILPDADIEMATRIVADSAFGCAGQRCLAASIAITVGEASNTFGEAICDAAVNRVVGYGLDPSVQMGPVISSASQTRIQNLIGIGAEDGAAITVDGRGAKIKGFEEGFFIKPTILQDVPIGSKALSTEIFGPVLSLLKVDSIDEAISLVNQGGYGNMACLFTSNGAAARKFRYEANVGNVGVNVGIAAPMAFFPFSGWKESFFGVMHGQGWDAVEFFTQKKVVVERWPKEWTRKF
jgi:malonate-semialdehyde dehydrogenase (acetylating)/methylmalonate-semialdehyde dehydrogenase